MRKGNGRHENDQNSLHGRIQIYILLIDTGKNVVRDEDGWRLFSGVRVLALQAEGPKFKLPGPK